MNTKDVQVKELNPEKKTPMPISVLLSLASVHKCTHFTFIWLM